MRKFLAILLPVAVLAIACSNYGSKVKINDKSEVYYKDGATEADAKKLGDFLLKNNYFDDKTEKSVQLTKVTDTFHVKFVVDKDKVKDLENAEGLFQIMGYMISTTVFGNKPVKIVLADKYMEPIKVLAPLDLGPTENTTDTTAVKDTTQTN